MHSAGDVDGGKAWKAVRRPSDMVRAKYVYQRCISHYNTERVLETNQGITRPRWQSSRQSICQRLVSTTNDRYTLADCVSVLGVKNLVVPIPEQRTAVSCTLNNGIHFVTTPECLLEPNCRIEQEFELYDTLISSLIFTKTQCPSVGLRLPSLRSLSLSRFAVILT